MSKRIIIIFIILVTVNIVLTLFSLYSARINQARLCIAVSALNDNIMTTNNGTVFDEQTAGIFNECVGHSTFLVPGF